MESCQLIVKMIMMCVKGTYSNAFFLKEKDILYSTNPKKKKTRTRKRKQDRKGGWKESVRGEGCGMCRRGCREKTSKI